MPTHDQEDQRTGSISSGEVRALRRVLGWSARDLASFFGHTHSTVYNWENNAQGISASVAAVMKSLRRETERRRRRMTAHEFRIWSDEVKSRQVSGYLESLEDRPSGEADRSSVPIEVGEERIVVVQEDRSVVFVVPVPSGWYRQLKACFESESEPGDTSPRSDTSPTLRDLLEDLPSTV